MLITLAIVSGIVFYTSVRQDEGKWKKVAELEGSAGNQYIVAQKHYHWVEGWAVQFFHIDKNEKLHGSSLQIETDRWRNVRLTEERGVIKVWRGRDLAADFTEATGVFHNRIYGFAKTNGEGGSIPANLFVK